MLFMLARLPVCVCRCLSALVCRPEWASGFCVAWVWGSLSEFCYFCCFVQTAKRSFCKAKWAFPPTWRVLDCGSETLKGKAPLGERLRISKCGLH